MNKILYYKKNEFYFIKLINLLIFISLNKSQRILSLHKKNIENYRIKKNNETEKNNIENNVVKNNEKFKADNIYEKNKKWEKQRNEKIENLKENFIEKCPNLTYMNTQELLEYESPMLFDEIFIGKLQ